MCLYCKCPGKRFWAKVRLPDESVCWPYPDKPSHQGYGRVSINGHVYEAHIVSWVLTHGPIVGGLHVLHKCDNRICCNPAHLFLGTHVENMQDMWQKGRAYWQTNTNWRPYGANHPQSKLTDELATQLRNEYAAGGVTQKALGRKYRLHQSTVSEIITRRIWRHCA